MYSESLKKRVLEHRGKIHCKSNAELQSELLASTSWCDTDEPNYMRVYCLLNDVYEYPMCPCGQTRLEYNVSEANGFKQFCSRSCTAKREHNSNIHKQRHKHMTVEQKNLINQKQKQTTLNNYGVDNYFKLPSFIESNYSDELVCKRDAARLVAVNNKYGVSNVSHLSAVVKKIKNTSLKRYGVTNPTQRHMSANTLSLLNDYDYMLDMTLKYTSSYIASVIGCDSSTVLLYAKKHGIVYKKKSSSYEETILSNALDKLGVEYVMSYSGLVTGTKQQVDFFFPHHNFAVEVNGLYWHSETVRSDVNYHQNKYERLQENNIKLIQFWDYEVKQKTELCLSIIKHNLGITDRKVHARKCVVKTVNSTSASSFITMNHIQPLKSNNIHLAYGLYSDGDLVSVMTFTRTGRVYTLQRYCNSIGTSVAGAFTRLLKHFTRTTQFESLVTYSDARYSNGDVYLKNGFEKVHTSKTPTYYYTKDFTMLYTRHEFTRTKIERKYPEMFNSTLTERENMHMLGYTIVNGCCITKWVYDKKHIK